MESRAACTRVRRILADRDADGLGTVLTATVRWLVEHPDGEMPADLLDAFRHFTFDRRSAGRDLASVLDHIATLEDALLEGIAESAPPAPEMARRIRTVARRFVSEAVRLNRRLDARRHRDEVRSIQSYGDIMAHELGNRLGAARTGLDLLQDQSTRISPERRAQLVRLICAGVDAALETADDVRAFINTHEWAVEQRLPLEAVIRSTSRGLRPIARRNGVTLRIIDEIPIVSVPAGHLRLVLSNLLINGIRYADASKRDRWVTVCVTLEGGGIVIEICDNGIGIPADQRERIFRYGQRAGLDGERPDGKGLGLAIVLEAVTQLGGQVRVDSEPGRGSTFVVRIPVRETAPQS